MLCTYREARRSLFEHASLRIDGAVALAARNQRTPEALTPGLQIVIPLRGAFVYELGSSHSLLTANHTLFIAAGDVSRDRFLDQHPLEYMLVTPQPDALSALLGDAAADSLRKLTTATRVICSPARLQHAAATFWNWSQRERGNDSTELEESALALMRHLLQAAGVEHAQQRRVPGKLVAAVKDLIGTGRETLSLTSIAAQLDVSPAYLTDLFRRSEGITIARYQRRLRLSRALLELPHAADLSALALELGFASHAHFSTVFRTTYGETPSTYRVRMRSGRGSICGWRGPQSEKS